MTSHGKILRPGCRLKWMSMAEILLILWVRQHCKVCLMHCLLLPETRDLRESLACKDRQAYKESRAYKANLAHKARLDSYRMVMQRGILLSGMVVNGH